MLAPPTEQVVRTNAAGNIPRRKLTVLSTTTRVEMPTNYINLSRHKNINFKQTKTMETKRQWSVVKPLLQYPDTEQNCAAPDSNSFSKAQNRISLSAHNTTEST
jgi:hypothetical protein